MGDAQDRSYKTAAEILALDDLADESVYVERWATTVRVRSMTAGQRQKFEELAQRLAENKGITPTAFRIETVIMCAAGEDGKPLFTKDDKAALLNKDADAIRTVFRAALRVSKLPFKDEDAVTTAVDTSLEDTKRD